ncbi:MAG: hypothetical protein R6W31_09570 [Bacteroidales bacterium]
MKSGILFVLLFASILFGCGPSQKIVTSWINPEAWGKGPYKSIFVIVLAQNQGSGFDVEEKMAVLLNSRGTRAVRSTDVFPPKLSISENFTREQLAEAIKRTGCDAVFIISALDVLNVETYHPGSAYNPMNYGYYGSYYGYYNYYSPQIYSPGYYSSDKTYYIETNFYDIESDQLLWSIQSEAYNPTNIDTWFDKYSYDLLNELKDEGLITK